MVLSQIDFTDASIMNGPLGSEPSIEWLDGSGQRRPDWLDTLPASSQLSPDDAVWPADLQEHKDFFRRRGSKLSDSVGAEGFVKGDFGALRQLVAEYLSTSTTPQSIREQYGKFPVLNILIEAYVYLIARFDIDGFRMDTVKYVNPLMVEIFGNAIREFALSIGKRNFFTFGEIYDDEQTINNFVGRNTSSTEGFGIDAALDFPLFYKLPGIAKSNIDVDEIRKVFKNRKETEKNLLSSHGEAGKYFVSFLDNHDQKERFNHPLTPKEQVLLGLGSPFLPPGNSCPLLWNRAGD